MITYHIWSHQGHYITTIPSRSLQTAIDYAKKFYPAPIVAVAKHAAQDMYIEYLEILPRAEHQVRTRQWQGQSTGNGTGNGRRFNHGY